MTLERHDAWGSDELQILYDFVNEEVWLDEAAKLLRRRTRNAIAVKMCELRREAGIVPKHRGPKAKSEQAWHLKRARAASEKLTEALLALDEAAAPALSEHDRREADTLRLAQIEEIDSVIRPGTRPAAGLDGADARIPLQLEFFDGPLFDWRHAA